LKLEGVKIVGVRQYISSLNGHSQITKILLEYGAHTETTASNCTPLCIAIKGEHFQDVELLLEHGAKTIYENLISPLHLSAIIDNPKIANLVLDHYLNSLNNLGENNATGWCNNNEERSFEVVVVRYNEDLSWIAKEFPNDKVDYL
jgi:ankyrin repeat protein